MVVNKIIEQLIYLGFSENEAKAYIALVQTNPVTAYEAAKVAGIPTSKIYEILAKLAEKGMVQVTSDEGKKKYVPIKPDEFLDKHKNSVLTTLDELKTCLGELDQVREVSYIWNIYKYEQLLEKAVRMIGDAEKNVLVSGWNEELAFVESVLQDKESQGVKAACINFGKVSIDIGQVFQHPIDDTIYSEKGGRGLVVVVDGKEAMIGTVYADKRVEGAWSKNSGFVTLAEDYIKHDVYIMKIVNRFNPQLVERFGNNYEKLRDVYHDEEA